ncbi:MAG: TIGR01777 family oxidoreductase [Candidatus Zixiibacteriota bacterium]
MATIAVTGAGGLIGSALMSFLRSRGDTVIRLVRSHQAELRDAVFWDPAGEIIDMEAFNARQVDAVVHLSGENLARGRWTAARKKRIYESRIRSTSFIARSIAGLEKRPSVLASASAIGFYGDRDDDLVDEESRRGDGFLADLCQDWEGAAAPAEAAGIRVVNLRIGLVLSKSGGTLRKMLPLFRLGLGGCLGSGTQYMSWIAFDDLLKAVDHCLKTDMLTGPVNLVSPNPVTNREFTRTLGAVLRRPTVFRVPEVALRLAFGEMADQALLFSTRVEPRRLKETGFTFQFRLLEDALRHILRRG